MMSLNGAHRNFEKIRRHIMPPKVEIVVGWDDEAEVETVSVLFDGKPQKTVSRDLWEKI